MMIEMISKTWPNLGLMKLSTKLRSEGYTTQASQFFTPLDYHLHPPERILISVIFSWDVPWVKWIQKNAPCEVEIGGPVFPKTLDPSIDEIPPDYSLYPISYSYLITSRGCPNRCSFCLVPKIEPKLRVIQNWRNHFHPHAKEAVFIDSNFLAQSSDHVHAVCNYLSENHIRTDFNQALDPMKIPEYIFDLKKINWKVIRIAFDERREEAEVAEAMRLIRKHITTDHRKITVFCLVGFRESFEDNLYRIQKVIDWGGTPFAMPYKSPKSKTRALNGELQNLVRWANKPRLWRSISFGEYRQDYRNMS